MVKVFGHKSPDTDATCSPIAMAWLLSKKGEEAKAFVLGDLNRETKYVLDKFGLEYPEVLPALSEGEKVVIVDTNNTEELPENINDTEIIEIVDHHKLFGGLMTSSPTRVTMKPLACSATLVYFRMKEESIVPEKNIAGIMLAAILSDTLKFTSPTTTEEDKKAAEELLKIAEVDQDSLAAEMFAAKSDLTGMNAKDVLYMDSKVFEFGSKKVRISGLETTKPENAKSMIEEIKLEMENIKKDEKLDSIFFFIVDILNTSSELFVSSETEKGIAEKAFGKAFEGQFMNLPGVVSRKKQMAPAFEKVIS